MADINSNLDVSTGGLFEGIVWDYISIAYTNSTTETFTYKTGGSGGTTVATVTVVYTDSTKVYISSVTKS